MYSLKHIYIFLPILISHILSQNTVPLIHSNMYLDINGEIYVQYKDKKEYENPVRTRYTLTDMIGNPEGTKDGISFNFNDTTLMGTLYYGFIPYADSRHPMPVYFKNPAKIEKGRAKININRMSGRYDMIGWEKNEMGSIGYRVVNDRGLMIYNGIILFQGKGPFLTGTTIIEGPMINCLDHNSVIISFTTSRPVICILTVNGMEYEDDQPVNKHEIRIQDLEPDTVYDYELECENSSQRYSFKTAPRPGTRKPFIFSYASDSRDGQGGGERNVYGTNFYIMRKIMALSMQNQVSFIQFTGDLINGYLTDKEEMNLQYANWKNAIRPYACYLPVYTGMGNHESLMRNFGAVFYGADNAFRIDGFPYESSSSESVFAENFVHPLNGPESEDDTKYDPDSDQTDFPSYKENVYYYTYDNTAMIVMNTDYWYAPSTSKIPITSGGLHGYIMDGQLAWIKKVIMLLESDDAIDHIFVTGHTPFFPNGGHVSDDMWYNGNNNMRPYIAGKPVEKGIIERRDELLDIFINKSKKVIAILTGDEHNYNKLEIDAETEIYPQDYNGQKIRLSRTIYQINNGAAGAPYYAQEITPWTPKVSGFTTQNALVFFHVNGNEIKMLVINPETLEKIDELRLR